jgi:peptide/nickel transport system permease protein
VRHRGGLSLALRAPRWVGYSALPIVPSMAPVARASTLSIVAMPFIDASRAAGVGYTRIIRRHITPNIVAPYLIMVSAFMVQAMLLQAGLSFLGLGYFYQSAL